MEKNHRIRFCSYLAQQLNKNIFYLLSVIAFVSPTLAQTESISSGTGFFVIENGFIATNAHVVRGCKSLIVRSRDQGINNATVLITDIKNDIAILKLDNFTKKVPYPALNFRARLGENAYVFGYPLTGVLSDTGNFTIGSVTSLQGIGNDSSRLQISTPVQPGNSGGPVLDEKGSLIGVVVGKLDALKNIAATKDIAQNVNFAIKSQILDGVLQSLGITVSASTTTQTKQAVEIAELAQNISVQIICKEDRQKTSPSVVEKPNKPPGSSEIFKDKSKNGSPVLLGSFGNVGVYAANTAQHGRVCYILAQPRERLPAGVARDPGFLFISTRPAANTYNEVSIVLGFPPADGLAGELYIGDRRFMLVTKANSAWLNNPSEDKNVIELMKTYSTMKTKITSRSGVITYDTYQLSGIDRAMSLTRRECP